MASGGQGKRKHAQLDTTTLGSDPLAGVLAGFTASQFSEDLCMLADAAVGSDPSNLQSPPAKRPHVFGVSEEQAAAAADDEAVEEEQCLEEDENEVVDPEAFKVCAAAAHVARILNWHAYGVGTHLVV